VVDKFFEWVRICLKSKKLKVKSKNCVFGPIRLRSGQASAETVLFFWLAWKVDIDGSW
jgi:hypothetical protein